MGLRQNPIPRAKGILGRLWPRVPGRPRLGVMEQPRTKQFVMFSVEGKPDTPKCMTIMFWPILKQVPMRVNEPMLIWKRLFKTSLRKLSKKTQARQLRNPRPALNPPLGTATPAISATQVVRPLCDYLHCQSSGPQQHLRDRTGKSIVGDSFHVPVLRWPTRYLPTYLTTGCFAPAIGRPKLNLALALLDSQPLDINGATSPDGHLIALRRFLSHIPLSSLLPVYFHLPELTDPLHAVLPSHPPSAPAVTAAPETIVESRTNKERSAGIAVHCKSEPASDPDLSLATIHLQFLSSTLTQAAFPAEEPFRLQSSTAPTGGAPSIVPHARDVSNRYAQSVQPLLQKQTHRH
ncbi:hypothetical protein CH63R_11836 [Colletotrichum higginsianum IMI 349063]|uniref:Uncharacterized protein n=1 Tax=Colletotrichum higginsianum (strain IMI 349063) TaxID=759273 RepID=A0A1B7XZD3_COLHI|nr:hypothetical protein CH63R_11836 [Colletotrichum higginsianum IMI 349063]OBR05133.1 hypothetical protein CH63R_11836 [Colletotrichum higginsianum IMI 349063]